MLLLSWFFIFVYLLFFLLHHYLLFIYTVIHKFISSPRATSLSHKNNFYYKYCSLFFIKNKNNKNQKQSRKKRIESPHLKNDFNGKFVSMASGVLTPIPLTLSQKLAKIKTEFKLPIPLISSPAPHRTHHIHYSPMPFPRKFIYYARLGRCEPVLVCHLTHSITCLVTRTNLHSFLSRQPNKSNRCCWPTSCAMWFHLYIVLPTKILSTIISLKSCLFLFSYENQIRIWICFKKMTYWRSD